MARRSRHCPLGSYRSSHRPPLLQIFALLQCVENAVLYYHMQVTVA